MSKFSSREEYERWKAERVSRPGQPVSSLPGGPSQTQAVVDAGSSETEKAIRRAWQFGTIMGVFSLIFVIAALSGYPVFGHTAWDLIDVAFIFLLSFGVYKKNRTSALLLFFYYILAKTVFAMETGNYAGIGAAVVFGYFLFNGVRGTFAYHKARGADGDGTAWKPVVAATSVAVLLAFVLFADRMGLSDLLPGAGGFAQTADWREVAVADAGFSIEMPGEPVKGTKSISVDKGGGTIEMTYYSVRMTGKKEYAIFYYDIPDHLNRSDSLALFKQATDTGLNQLKGRLVSEKPLVLGKWPGKEAHVENDQEAFRSLMFLVDGRFYHLIAYQEKDQAYSTDAERFMSSFKLTAPDGQILIPRDPLDAAWLNFSPEGARFSVELPGTPVVSQEHVETSAGKVIVHRFDLNRDEISEQFSVQYADYPEKLLRKMKTAEVVLSSSASADVENFKGTVVSQKTLTTEPYPGKELHIENADAGMRLRMYLKDGRLYKVKAVCPKGLLFTTEDDRFMDSFRLLPLDKGRT